MKKIFTSYSLFFFSPFHFCRPPILLGWRNRQLEFLCQPLATTSGGTVFHVTIPSPSDDVFFDANSFPTRVIRFTWITTITNCRNMDWTGAQFNSKTEVQRNLKFLDPHHDSCNEHPGQRLLLRVNKSGNTITSRVRQQLQSSMESAVNGHWWIPLMLTRSSSGWNFLFQQPGHFLQRVLLCRWHQPKSHLPGNFSPDHYRWRLANVIFLRLSLMPTALSLQSKILLAAYLLRRK